jgi:Ca2+-transporting ATPase
MSVIPEEFPVVLTLFLALGAWRLAQRHVLTHRMPVIETLGAVTVLCTDKTGTLTQNRMSAGSLMAARRPSRTQGPSAETALTFDEYDILRHADDPVPEPFFTILRASVLASLDSPFDPMERALHEVVGRSLPPAEHLDQGLTFVREYPLTPGLLAVTRVWLVTAHDRASQDVASHDDRSPTQHEERVVAAKGAHEAIAELCALDAEHRDALFAQVGALAQRGLRVLAVAQATERRAGPSADLPERPRAFTLTLLGVVGLADPIRTSVPAAIRDCHTAGIRVVMITGDYPATAQAITRQIGLRETDHVMTGAELAALSENELRERAPKTAIFARVVPQQKLRLVQALKATGEIVGMTGDESMTRQPCARRTSASRWVGAAPMWPARPQDSCYLTTTSRPLCLLCAAVGASSTTCAMRWPSSSPSISR